MTAEERAAMRDTLRAAVGRARLPGAELAHPGAFRPRSSGEKDALTLVERFRAELTALAGTVHEARDVDEVAAVIEALVRAETTPTVMMWDERWLPVQGLAGRLSEAGMSICTQAPETVHSREHRLELASASVGITGADAGLAETGSIVLRSGPGRGRLASLLPPVHVALLERRLLTHSLPVLLSERPELVTAGANFVCITGPSRTADIEHTLTRGVHGPGEIHVVLVG